MGPTPYSGYSKHALGSAYHTWEKNYGHTMSQSDYFEGKVKFSQNRDFESEKPGSKFLKKHVFLGETFYS